MLYHKCHNFLRRSHTEWSQNTELTRPWKNWSKQLNLFPEKELIFGETKVCLSKWKSSRTVTETKFFINNELNLITAEEQKREAKRVGMLS